MLLSFSFFMCWVQQGVKWINGEGGRHTDSTKERQQILPIPSQYIFSLFVFVNKNINLCSSNSEIHDKNKRFNHNLHLPNTNLTLVQKGVLYSGSKIYNHLPLHIKMLSKHAKQFKSTLRSFLTEHTFYSLDEYYQLTT